MEERITDLPHTPSWKLFMEPSKRKKFKKKTLPEEKSLYLLIFRERGREKERERNINAWLPLKCPLLGTWPATQACALTGNQISNPLVHRPALNPLSDVRTGQNCFYKLRVEEAFQIKSFNSKPQILLIDLSI